MDSRLFVQQLVQSEDKKPPKVRITDPVCIINLMKCPLTKGHYCGKHIQVMTSSWCQLILGKIWKPAVRSSRLVAMKITKHGYRVSLCKTSTFSIVLNSYEPWAKGTNFEIYSRDHWTHRSWIILSLQRVGTNSFHLLRQYWSLSDNDLNSETRYRCNKSFYLICVIERIPCLRSTAVSFVRIFICIRW